METITTKGLVIKQTNYGEADRILHIFTQDLGIVSAIAKGARKFKSHQGLSSQLLYYSLFTLAPGKNMYSLRGAECIESFFSLSERIDSLALCMYFFDITSALTPEGVEEREILSLLLNTLYILSKNDRPLKLIKAVYELKLLSLAGFEAQYDTCLVCGKKIADTPTSFSASMGGLVCQTCQVPSALALSRGAANSIKYILSNSVDKIFSFSISPEALDELSEASEKFIIECCERTFLSLSYYKSVSDM